MKSRTIIIAIGLSLGLLNAAPAMADEFSKQDVYDWYKEYLAVVRKGDKLFHKALGDNSVSCDQCHPNATNTHPETYPKFQNQLGKVATLHEMINWCIRNTADGQDLAADDPDMIALQAYIAYERRGVRLDPGKH
jgi:thiosulfate dehydrogenase